MTAQLRPAPIGHSRQPGDAAWPSRVVVLNDVSVVRGGATAMALLSARKIAEKGIPVAYISGDEGRAVHDIPRGVSFLTAGSRHVREGARLGAALRGLYNTAARDFVAGWIRDHDTPGTVYHLHGWSKILSPAIFTALQPVRDRLVLSAHDFFLACPNGGYFDFRSGESCSRAPLGAACLTTNCDRRGYHEKLYRVARHRLMQALAGLGEDGPPILAVHDEMLPHLERGGIRSSRLRALRNPVTPWSAERIAAETNREFLFVGRLEEDKGILLAAAAARQAGVPLGIVGGGPLAARLAEEYPEMRQYGWQDRYGLDWISSNARAVVMPTRYREAFGLVAVEAMTSGLPLVIAEHAMIAPEVTRGGMGIACDPNDVGALAATLRRLAEDNAAVGEMSHRGHERAMELAPTTTSWALSLLATYAEVLRKTADAPRPDGRG